MKLPNLPIDWCWSKLGEVAKWGSGGTPSRSNEEYYGGNIPWIKSGELNDSYVFDTEEKLSDTGLANSSAKLFPTGSIAIAMYGATIGKLGILGTDCTCNQACGVATTTEVLEPMYLFYYLKSSKHALIKRGQGGAQPNISQQILKEFPIPVPPVSTQRRITSVLAQADTLIQKRTEAIAKLDELIDSMFLNVVGDLRSNSLEWEFVELAQLIVDTTNGITRRGKYDDSGNIVLKLKDIRVNHINFSEPNRFALNETEKTRFKLDEGDLLFIRVNGNPEYVGRCAVFQDGLTEHVYYNDHIMRVRINNSLLNPEFLSRYLNSTFGKIQIRDKLKTSAGQFTINQQGLSAINVPLIPLRLQQDFLSKVAEIEVLKDTMAKQLIVLQNNLDSLLHQAFTGQLQLREEKVDEYAVER